MILILKDDQLHFLVFSLAVLFTLLGFGIFHYQQNELKAQAVRDYRNVIALEKRLDRFDQVIALYQGIKPMLASNGVSRD